MLPGARNATFNWVCAEAWRPWGTLPGSPPDDAVDGAAGRGSTRVCAYGAPGNELRFGKLLILAATSTARQNPKHTASPYPL